VDKQPNFLQAVVAVLWAFLGIRKGKASLTDQGLKPVHFIVAGLFAGGVFVATLLLIVRFIIRSAAR
jgi:Protein of unknown function (DUF2970)